MPRSPLGRADGRCDVDRDEDVGQRVTVERAQESGRRLPEDPRQPAGAGDHAAVVAGEAFDQGEIGLDPDQGADIVAGIAEGCRQAGCALIGGETAEMPGMYREGDYDLAGFAVGAAERGQLLPAGDIAEGDVILGLASSGVHSNGYSLVRKIVELSGLGWDAQAPFDAGKTLGEALLTPTKIYVKPLLKAIRETGAIKALAHITGGGFPENIPRVLPKTLSAEVDLAAIPVKPVFRWIAATGGVAEKEMLRTFNCGIGMIAVVPAEQAEAVAAILTAEGETVVTLGRMIARTEGAAGVSYKGTLAL